MKLVAILGAGLSGLSAGYALAKGGKPPAIFEAGPEVGGASRTLTYKGFRFDLGGHRFYSKKEDINRFLRDLMGDEMIEVSRVSKICLGGKRFNYPLTPANAFFGMGPLKTLGIFADYAWSKLRNTVVPPPESTYEDWVTNRFGRILARLFFLDYAEKLWGIPCDRLSLDFANQRIKSLSLAAAIRNAFRRSSEQPATLIRRFTYPKRGFGRIAERLAEEIGPGSISLNTPVVGAVRTESRIEAIRVKGPRGVEERAVEDVISTVPITDLVRWLDPRPEDDVLAAAGGLRFRNMIFVFLVLDRDRVTTDTWMYFPQKDIPFSRIHEPKNWSGDMAPEGKTSLVVEYFCSESDELWRRGSEDLRDLTVEHLVRLGQIEAGDVIDSTVIRLPKAYPIYDMGYKSYLKVLVAFLARFKNLQLIGRNGAFRYTSSDHYLDMGIKAAENLLGAKHDLSLIGVENEYAEE